MEIMDAAVVGDLPRTGTARLEGPVQPELVRDEVLAEIFAATVAARPQHAAIVFGQQRISYAELDRRSDEIARGLTGRGIGPGDVVGLWMERGADLLVAQIAITKTGAAWLPFDADAPADRIAVCLDDAEAKALLVSPSLADKAPVQRPVLTPQRLAQAGEGPGADPRARGLTPDHPAYMIYTSGSTGVPKGIVITHRNICHFLRSANEIYGFSPDDIVFQGASVAFDLSMEEIWIPLMVGATLFVATPAIMGDLEGLPDLLTEAGVTILDTVPTLLAMLPRDVPGLRLILLGGEALPSPLVARWVKPGRKLFNTYGPTEATVVATISEVTLGQPVTIGRPIPNYTTYIVDEDLRLCPPGVQGELLIGGPGVARGYLKRPELTAEKFIPNPFPSQGRDPILYRSGDAVSLDTSGNIAFHGRIDDQVKIRGFRVELGEIEARLAHQPGIAQAAVVLRPDEGMDRLVAFLVPELHVELSAPALRTAMRREVPPYMVPDHFEAVEALPRLSSGKIDRKSLRTLPLAAQDGLAEVQEEPQNDTEAALLAAAHRALGQRAMPFDGDFFADLGGHSLLAARFVSILRETPALASITLQDVYAKRTLRAMAALLIERNGGVGSQAAVRDLSFEPPPFRRRFLCGLAQAIVLPFIIGLVTVQWLGLFIASVFLLQEDAGLLREMVVLLGLYTAINLGIKALIVGLKWLVLGRTKPGRYPIWGVYYFRVWFVQRMVQVTTLKFLGGSPLMRVYLRLLGARIGRDAIISEFECGAIDLLTIGDRASTGMKIHLGNVEVIGPIEIGADAVVGNSCVIGGGARIGAGAELEDLTSIPADGIVGPGEIWDGSPGRKVGMVDPATIPDFPQAGSGRRFTQGLVYTAGYLVILMLGLVPIFPAFYVLYNLDSFIKGYQDTSVAWSSLPMLAWPTAFALVVVSVLIIIAFRWIVLPRVKAGSYSIHSWFYVRKWLVALATEVTLETLNSLYATLYMRHWYRLMGAKIGRGSEVSTNLAGRYDLVDIGEDNFLGDEVIFGDEEIRRGWMILDTVRTGDRVFVGNDAVIAAGSVLADDTLIGVKSKMPDSLKTQVDETWFGSPAISVPARQRIQMGEFFTYRPPRSYIIRRAIFEAFHTSLPTAIFITFGYMTADLMSDPLERGDVLGALGIFFASGVTIALVLVFVAAAIKWLLMGAYKPIHKPMWSWWAMKTEAVAVLYGGLVGKASLEFTRGTPFLPMALRVFGTKIGRGVYMDSTDVTEFDCVHIGDFAVLNDHAVLQTHLYEDRIMKVGRIEVGRGVSVGTSAKVLYDTKVGDYARLGSLTVVMRGESIPGHTEWEGAPAIPVVHQAPSRPDVPQLATAAQ
jgi:non-ribosomal peptide synthetase-like protein